jgi:hypothetical protein
MKVLLIDDKESELQKAVEAASRLGWEYVTFNPERNEDKSHWIDLVSNVDCVATDLMWVHDDRYGEKPVGLMVVIHCLFMGKPVTVCTNGDDYAGGHHGEAIGFINNYRTNVKYSKGVPKGKLPFGWIDWKNWDHALKFLVTGKDS